MYRDYWERESTLGRAFRERAVCTSFYYIYNIKHNDSKLEEEEDNKIEELQRAIADAKAEEKRLLHEIDRYKSSIAQFVATLGSQAAKE